MHTENLCKVQSSPTTLLGLLAPAPALDLCVSSQGCGERERRVWSGQGRSFTRGAQDQLRGGKALVETERRTVAAIVGNLSPLLLLHK